MLIALNQSTSQISSHTFILKIKKVCRLFALGFR